VIVRIRACTGGATSYFETGLKALLSMRAQALEPHAEERRSRVSKYEVALAPMPTNLEKHQSGS